MDCAAGYGCHDAVKWLRSYRTEDCTAYAMNSAAKHVVMWLNHNSSKGCTYGAMIGAARAIQLRAIQFYRCKITDDDVDMFIYVARHSGHFDIAGYLGGSMLGLAVMIREL